MKDILRKYGIGFLFIIGLYIVLIALINNNIINRYYEGILIAIGINIILASSLNLATGFLGQLALGHAGFMAIGAYTAALATIGMNLPDAIQLPVSLLLGGLVSGIIGILIGIPALRLRGDYLGIITLGFGEMIRVFIVNVNFTGGARGLKGIEQLAGFHSVFWITVITIFILYTLTHSRHGRAIISIREDEIAAEAVGIPTVNYKLLGFAVAAFFAGVGGGVFAHYMTVLDPKTFNFIKSVEILVIVVLGGMGSLTGSIISAITLTILPEALRNFAKYRLLLYSFLLIVMMIFRPEGILGTKEFSLKGLKDTIDKLFRMIFKKAPKKALERSE